MGVQNLGETITAMRVARRMSQGDLEAEAGLKSQRLTYIERGIGNPSPKEVTALERALGAKLAHLPLGGRKDIPPTERNCWLTKAAKVTVRPDAPQATAPDKQPEPKSMPVDVVVHTLRCELDAVEKRAAALHKAIAALTE